MDTPRSSSRGSFHPEPETAPLERFRVDDPAEIRALLRRMCAGSELIGLFPDGRSFVLSKMLSVEASSVELDLGESADLAWEMARTARELVCVAYLDSVKVQFRAPVLPGEGLKLAFPRRVYRMQRREGYRVRPTASEPVWCLLHTSKGAKQHQVLDLSVVGVALCLPAHEPPPAVGARLEDARLRLPGPRLLPCALTVRRVQSLPQGAGHRVGCSFERMPLESSRILQKVVMDIERAGRKR